MLLGQSVFNAFHFNPLKQAHLLEVLAELAVLLSTVYCWYQDACAFQTWRAWRAPLRLAFISMIISVALAAVFGLPEELAVELIHITLVVVVLSHLFTG
jgi:hypothetical protein